MNRVIAPEKLMEETMAYARELATFSSPASMAVMKAQVYDHPLLPLADAMSESNRLMVASLKQTDFKEGVASFLEKRNPNFAPYPAPAVAD